MRKTALAVFCAAAIGVAAQEVPIVKVKVDIDSKASAKKQVNARTAEKSAQTKIVEAIKATEKLSFVNWVPHHEPGTPFATFYVRLWDEPQASPLLPTIHFVKYHAEITAKEAQKARFELTYANGQKFFKTAEARAKLGDADTLADALAQIVVGHLVPNSGDASNAVPNAHFLSAFLYLVPLSYDKPTLKDDGTIVVAVPWSELKAAEKSVLRVWLEAKPAEARVAERGNLRLSSITPCQGCGSGNRPSAHGAFAGFSCSPFGPLTAEEKDKWKSLAPAVRVALTAFAVVFMDEYFPNFAGAPLSGHGTTFQDFDAGSN